MAPWLDLARLHAPLLVFAAGFAGVAVALLAPQRRLAWALAVLAAAAAGAVGFDLAARELLGAAPVARADEGVGVVADGAGVFSAALVSVTALLTIVSAGALIGGLPRRVGPFAIAAVIAVSAAWCAALFASDFIGVILAVETAWLASLTLVAVAGESERGAINGASRMLALGGVSAALMALGAGILWRALGSLEVDALARLHTEAPGAAGVGVGLLLLGLVMKAGLAPFHVWLAPAFGRGGGLGAMVLGAVGAVGALAVIGRVAGFAIPAPGVGEGVSAGLAAIGALSVVVGSLQAAGARNAGRLAGYACAAQAGGVLLCFALGSPAGFAAGFVQLFALAAAMLALLAGFAAGRVTGLDTLDGLGRRAPLASVAITAGALALMGAPLTIGFLGRWRLIEAGVGAGWWWAAGAVVVASLAGVFYGGRLIERMYFKRATAAADERPDAWNFALAPALVASTLAIAFGFSPALLLQAANRAADLLMGVAQ